MTPHDAAHRELCSTFNAQRTLFMISLACAPLESQSTALRRASIDNLPNELILLFLYLLDAQDLVSYRQVFTSSHCIHLHAHELVFIC